MSHAACQLHCAIGCLSAGCFMQQLAVPTAPIALSGAAKPARRLVGAIRKRPARGFPCALRFRKNRA